MAFSTLGWVLPYSWMFHKTVLIRCTGSRVGVKISLKERGGEEFLQNAKRRLRRPTEPWVSLGWANHAFSRTNMHLLKLRRRCSIFSNVWSDGETFKSTRIRAFNVPVLTLFWDREEGRQCGSVVRAGDLNAGDPGPNPRLGLLNEFVLGDPMGKFTTLCK